MAARSLPPAGIYEHLGAKEPGWTPFSPAVANAIRRALPERQRMYAASCGLFLGLVYRKQKQLSSDWVKLSYPTIADEVAGSFDLAKRIVRMTGIGGLGLVAKRSGDKDNANEYALIHSNIHNFWNAHGPQPALVVGRWHVPPTGRQHVLLTGLMDGCLFSKQDKQDFKTMRRVASEILLTRASDDAQDPITARVAARMALIETQRGDEDEAEVSRVAAMPEILWWYLACVRMPQIQGAKKS